MVSSTTFISSPPSPPPVGSPSPSPPPPPSSFSSFSFCIEYLHGNKLNKPALVHENISVKNVLLVPQFKPLLSDSGLHQLLTKDTVFSSLKASAAMGYLAPDAARFAVESCTFIDFVDPNLHGRLCEHEAAKFAKVALRCTHESPDQRPSVEEVVQELSNLLC
ncbi:hypothetical protein L1987_24833 [Smallanthus sonchifolius]|uniref:Uncharacterized protein n=1 Tax=Smallanthus sonchifolius TaxID=185202 RepID=A0ACB9IMZ9_9ASTR|nr:hypothetical protein L1987_24833 [Smallanthus sonchifolius]